MDMALLGAVAAACLLCLLQKKKAQRKQVRSGRPACQRAGFVVS